MPEGEARIEVRVRPEARADAAGLAELADGEELALEMARLVLELERNPYAGDSLERELAPLRRIRFDTVTYVSGGDLPRFQWVYELRPSDGAPGEALVWAIGPRSGEVVYRKARARRER